MLLGHASGEAVLLARQGDEVFAVGATCTHWSAPLAGGLLVDGTIRCPHHHACFDLRSGEALTPPAFDALPCWNVERRVDRLFVLGKRPALEPPRGRLTTPLDLASIVILGGGGAGYAAATTLRREGYSGVITMITAEGALPTDRPNLSKDYLAGTAPEEFLPLRSAEFFATQGVDIVQKRATRIDVARKAILLEDGTSYAYGALLYATGAEAVKLSIPGSGLPHIHYLRTMADAHGILRGLAGARRVVVIGASFTGLEVAASLRIRGLEVHVVGPETRPFERVLGPQLGELIRGLHERHGVVFHLGRRAASITANNVVLDDGTSVDADLVVAGIGVRPSVALAEEAGLAVDRGVLVDRFLETSAAGIYAAGDVARWPDPRTGDRIRLEHWAVAQRHGQIAARNILGRKEPCEFVPFFWTKHYDVAIHYVGHAESWDHVDVDGDLARQDCRLAYRRGDTVLAVATVGRDLDSLRASRDMEAIFTPRSNRIDERHGA